MKNIALAIVDSYVLIRCAFANQLRLMGFDVIIDAQNVADFAAQLLTANEQPALCIVDIDVPCIEDYTIANQIKEYCPHTKIIAYTLYEKHYEDIRRFGIDIFIEKGCSFKELETQIKQLLQL